MAKSFILCQIVSKKPNTIEAACNHIKRLITLTSDNIKRLSL
jgi:hypothetical protein